MRRLSLALMAIALAAPAQSPTPHAAYRIAGTVVSAIDNHPLQRASIQLLNPEDQKTVQTTTSDVYGRFAFTGVPPGNHELQGVAPNYLTTMYDEHEGFNTGIITGAAVDTESLVLKLRPESVIAGTVVDESADPVQNATIHLFRQTHSFGDSRIVPAGNRNTDDLGHFELSHLSPGTYFLAVTATPWYAIHPSPSPIEMPPPAGFRRGPLRAPNSVIADSIDPTLDVAYPITFYPGTNDPSRAAPITIRGGESPDLHFQLSPQPAVTLTIPRPTPANGQPQSYPQLGLAFQGRILAFAGEINQTATQFVISGLAPGDYLLTQANRLSSGANPGTPIHVGDQPSTATLPDPPAAAHVHVALQSPPDARLPPRTQVILVRANREAAASAFIDAKNEAVIDAVPGDYTFEILGEQRYLPVGQIHSGDRLLPSNIIHLTSNESAFFTLAVLSRTHILKGFARKDGKPFPGAFVLLFPSDQAGNIRTPFRQQSDLDGSFDLRGLAPGAYTLLAIENGWDLDWQHVGALAQFLPHALTVQIPDTPTAVQNLPNPVPVQSR